MERISEKQVRNLFDLFLDSIGARKAASYKDVGGLQLDYNPVYGGWNIEQIVNEMGGVSQPFGMTRKNNREMYNALHFALDALQFTQKAERKAA